MKNVLFATTALVAFAGAASAETVNIDFVADMTVGYNDVIERGLFLDSGLGFEASMDLGDNVTATFEWEVATYDTSGPAFGVDVPTLVVGFDNGTLAASLTLGDQDDAGASELYYADRDGMAIDVANSDDVVGAVAVVEFGDFAVAVGCDINGTNDCIGMNVGASATFGSIDLGIGYDDAATAGGERTAVSADATFGSATVGVSYIADATDDSIGVAVGYDVSEALSVAAYYAANSAALITDAYGVSVSYTAGAMTVGAYYDDGDDGLGTNTSVSSYGLDLGYEVSDQLTANAGVFDDGTFVYYVGIDYAVNDNISATVSYATANEISGPEYKDGITALITASF